MKLNCQSHPTMRWVPSTAACVRYWVECTSKLHKYRVILSNCFAEHPPVSIDVKPTCGCHAYVRWLQQNADLITPGSPPCLWAAAPFAALCLHVQFFHPCTQVVLGFTIFIELIDSPKMHVYDSPATLCIPARQPTAPCQATQPSP